MYPSELVGLAEQLVAKLKSDETTITVAESCTGGLLGGLITSISGSSAVFNQGFITYSNEAKQRALGVPEALLNAHGAVSEEVAGAMAQGALAAANADIAISITGIAGPTGGTKEKPVGLVYMGCAVRGKSKQGKRSESVGEPALSHASCKSQQTFTEAKKYIFTGTREDVRLQACKQAVEMALSKLKIPSPF